MKTLMTITLLVVMVFTFASPAFAATVNSAAIPISASVDGSLTLSVSLFKDSNPVNGVGGGPVPGQTRSSINFGQLQVVTNTSTGGQTLRSTDAGGGDGGVVALISANSRGAHYTISQTGTQLTSGTNTIPSAACRMVPFYSSTDKLNGVDQGAMPAGASLGPAASWVGTRTIYDSETSNTAIRIVQAHYAVTDDPGAFPGNISGGAVQVNQAGGTYSATVTFTVVSP